MIAEQLIKMEPALLLSVVNTKLRDEYDSLIALCDDYNISIEWLQNRLNEIGFNYNKDLNQFK